MKVNFLETGFEGLDGKTLNINSIEELYALLRNRAEWLEDETEIEFVETEPPYFPEHGFVVRIPGPELSSSWPVAFSKGKL